MYIQRELEKEILPFLKRKEVIAIHGPRQIGKTTFLNHLKEKLGAKKSILELTFENRKDLQLFEKDIEDFKKVANQFEIVAIDEFQYAKEGGQKLKYLYDTTSIKFIITGSSSLELTYQTGKYMVGRIFNFNLWPFSFREFLSLHDTHLFQVLEKNGKMGDALNKKLEKYFENYLLYGGYPEVVLAQESGAKEKILESILENYFLRDIQSLLQLSTHEELSRLIPLLATQIGNLIDYGELGVASGLSYLNLKKHLRILRETYVIDLIKPYFKNKRTELVKNPKVYFIDPGLRNATLQNFQSFVMRNDIGALAENFVFNHFMRNRSIFHPVRFWRTKNKAEVDFILEERDGLIPIEVKYSPRLTIGKSLYSFIEKFSPKKAIIYTRGLMAKERVHDCTVDFIPVYYL